MSIIEETKENFLNVNDLNYLHRCNGCKTYKPNSEYRKYNKQKNIRKFASKCKKCSDLINLNWCDKNKEKVVGIKRKHYLGLSKEEKQRRYNKYIKNHYITAMFQTLKWNAKKRNLPVEIDATYVEELYEKQNHICYYTGKTMNLIKGDRDNVISVDRLDSSKGYTRDNVVLCCLKVNIVKNDLTYIEFIKLCEDIIKNKKI